MKKETIIIAIILLLIPLASAYEMKEINNAEEITTKVDISGSIQLEKKGPLYTIDVMRAELYNYPKDDVNQRVLTRHTEPRSEEKADALRYRWLNPVRDSLLGYQLTTTVKTENAYNPIKEKMGYPIRDRVERGYEIFLKPTEFIDSGDPAIKSKAKEIVGTEDDLYIIVSRTANWVNKQVKYDINTKTEKATQKASWVMKNKQGVCDEITALFIGLLRAAGIPARFISGISYTNIPQTDSNWGPHGWAEVYFPERGWLPYDITFGQYGWIDAAHIKFKELVDPRDKPTRFEWQGRDAGIKAEPLKIKAEITELKGKTLPSIRIKPQIAKIKTGFESYNLIVAEVENLKDFYITEELILADVEELEILGAKKKLAILKPNEAKKFFWRVKVKDNLNPEYEYKVPIEVYTLKDDSSETEFKVKNEYLVYSLDDIVKIQDSVESGEELEIEIEQEEITEEPIEESAEELTIIQNIIKWIKELFS